MCSSDLADDSGRRRPASRRADRGSGGPGWMLTLVDLVSLMLAFFVMRFAMTSLDSPRFDETAASISIARKSVVLGKSVALRVELGGRRIIKKNRTSNKHTYAKKH